MPAGLGSIDQLMVCVMCSASICISAPAAARRCSGSICISAAWLLGGAAPPSASQAAQQLPLVIRSILTDIGGPNSVLLEKVITIASSTCLNSVLKNLLRWHLFRLCRHSLKLGAFHDKGCSNKTTVDAIVAQPCLEGSVDTN
ncbi:hypothetical protein VPH35_031819 [Triticum aestivum]